MDAVASPETLEGVTSAAIAELAALALDEHPCELADELARALAAVSKCYSVPVPTHAASEIEAALIEVLDLLQRYRLYSMHDETEAFSPRQQKAMEAGVRLFWAHVTTYQLHAALIDLVRTVDFMPRAIAFWKKRRHQRVRAVIQRGPFEWFAPSSQRIRMSERVRSLQETLDAHLRKLGMLKELTTRSSGVFVHYDELERSTKEGMALLELTYSTSGLSPPRKGQGVFLTLDPLPFTAFYYDECMLGNDSQADDGSASGIKTCGDVLRSLRRVEANLRTFRAAQMQFAVCFNMAMAPCRPPSKIRQRWLHLTIAALCVTTGSVWIANNKREFRAALMTLKVALQDFLTEHMLEPIEAIVGEVILNKKAEIQDPAALLDTKESLQRMLSDFVKHTNPNVSAAEMQRIMESMDMSVVSLQFEKQLGSAVRNIMTGDIVRMLLIQVQFIKKELMVAMGAIDELMNANQLNLQILATIPTFLVFGGMYRLVKEVFLMVYRRTSERLSYDSSEIAAFLRNNLRDIERLLNKQNRPKGGDHGEEQMLGARDLGHLILLLHQLRDLFEEYRAHFLEDERERFEEDLNDLIEEGLAVSQQLAVIQRMYHSHPFLQSTKLKTRWLLA